MAVKIQLVLAHTCMPMFGATMESGLFVLSRCYSSMPQLHASNLSILIFTKYKLQTASAKLSKWQWCKRATTNLQCPPDAAASHCVRRVRSILPIVAMYTECILEAECLNQHTSLLHASEMRATRLRIALSERRMSGALDLRDSVSSSFKFYW